MDEKQYYLVPVGRQWILKRAGGVKVLKTFGSKAEALLYAQTLVSRQQAVFRVQDQDGHWEQA